MDLREPLNEGRVGEMGREAKGIGGQGVVQ